MLVISVLMGEISTSEVILGIAVIVTVCVVIAAKSDKMYASAMAVACFLGWAVFRYFMRQM